MIDHFTMVFYCVRCCKRKLKGSFKLLSSEEVASLDKNSRAARCNNRLGRCTNGACGNSGKGPILLLLNSKIGPVSKTKCYTARLESSEPSENDLGEQLDLNLMDHSAKDPGLIFYPLGTGQSVLLTIDSHEKQPLMDT